MRIRSDLAWLLVALVTIAGIASFARPKPPETDLKQVWSTLNVDGIRLGMNYSTARGLVKETPKWRESEWFYVPLTVTSGTERVWGVEGLGLYTDKKLIIYRGASSRTVIRQVGEPRAKLLPYPPTKPPISDYLTWVYPVGTNSVEILVDPKGTVFTVALRSYVETAAQ